MQQHNFHKKGKRLVPKKIRKEQRHIWLSSTAWLMISWIQEMFPDRVAIGLREKLDRSSNFYQTRSQIVEEFLNQALGGNKMYKAWQLANFGLIVKRMKKKRGSL